MNRKRLGEILVDLGVLSNKTLEDVLARQEQRAERLGELLVANGLAGKADIALALERGQAVKSIECPPEEIDPEVLSLVPANIAARCCALPISIEEKTLIVAMGEPQNMAILGELEFCTGMKIEPRFSLRGDVVAGIKRFYDQAVSPSPVAATTRVIVPERIDFHRMSWPVRVAVLFSFGVAAVSGWSAGTIVQQSLSRFLT